MKKKVIKKNSISSSSFSSNPLKDYGYLDDYQIDFQFVDMVESKKCECGAEKVWGKNTTHSSWCPKYEKT